MSTRVQMMRTGLAIVVGGYWLAIFVATHLPHVPSAFAMPGADKWEHLSAYATLAFLLATWQSFGLPLKWKHLFRVVVIAALYGAFDELTQIPVGRHADIADWFADLLGSVVGLAAFAVVQLVFVRCLKRSRFNSPAPILGSSSEPGASAPGLVAKRFDDLEK